MYSGISDWTEIRPYLTLLMLQRSECRPTGQQVLTSYKFVPFTLKSGHILKVSGITNPATRERKPAAAAWMSKLNTGQVLYRVHPKTQTLIFTA